jgi:hypothetical protein
VIGIAERPIRFERYLETTVFQMGDIASITAIPAQLPVINVKE